MSLRLSQTARSSQELRATVVDARGHAKAVEFYFMQPLRSRRSLLDQLGKLRRDEAWKGESLRLVLRRDGPGLAAPEASA